jgi:hypothetical protein
MATEPSESTIKACQDIETEEEGGDGTAKQASARAVSDDSPPSPSKTKSTDWRQSLSQARLSSVFETWLHPSPPTSPPRVAKSSTPKRMSVSEPKLLERTNGVVSSDTNSVDTVDVDLDTDGFEQMLVSARARVR